jgi:GPH family glycoside/pentoside/hexuronide:cation symporter
VSIAAESAPRPNRISFWTCLSFGIGTNGTATMLGVTGILLLYFMTTMLGIDPALAGFIIFASKIYDLTLDPIMGHISDRTHTRIGRRRPFLLLGAVVSALSLYMLFAVPQFDNQTATILYYIFALLVYATGYSIFTVPYLSMPAEMTEDYHERTRIMSFRTLFGTVGLLIGTAVAPVLLSIGSAADGAAAVKTAATAAPEILRPAGDAACVMGAAGGSRPEGTAEGYAFMGLWLGAIVFVSMALCFFGTAKARFTARTESYPSLVQQLKLVMDNRPFVLLACTKILQLTGVTAFALALPFLAQYVLQMSPASLGIFFGIYTLGSLIALPLWLMLSKRIGKKRAYTFATLFFIASDLLLLGGSPERMPLVYTAGFLVGVAAAGMILFGVSMLPDTMEYDYRRTGEKREGVYAGVWSTVEQSSAAIATLIAGAILSAAGFIETSAGQVACQPQSAIAVIQMNAAVVPAVMMGLSLLLLRRYDLSKEKLEAMAAR